MALYNKNCEHECIRSKDVIAKYSPLNVLEVDLYFGLLAALELPHGPLQLQNPVQCTHPVNNKNKAV